MESEIELNAKILAITTKIHNNHPELSKYLNEMPITIPTESSPEITTKILKDYYQSLVDMQKKYELEHPLKWMFFYFIRQHKFLLCFTILVSSFQNIPKKIGNYKVVA